MLLKSPVVVFGFQPGSNTKSDNRTCDQRKDCRVCSPQAQTSRNSELKIELKIFSEDFILIFTSGGLLLRGPGNTTRQQHQPRATQRHLRSGVKQAYKL
jgi:hypothetical protein